MPPASSIGPSRAAPRPRAAGCCPSTRRASARSSRSRFPVEAPMANDGGTGRTVAIVGGGALLLWLLLRSPGQRLGGGGSGTGAASASAGAGATTQAPSRYRPVCQVFVRSRQIDLDGVPADLPTVVARCRACGRAEVRATGGASIQAVEDVISALKAAGVTVAVSDRASTPGDPSAAALRNGGFLYRPVGDRGERYPAWLRRIRGSSGVYIIREQGGPIVYVGVSVANRLYETLTRHFQEWRRYKGFWRGQFAEGHDPGLTYDRASVEVAVKVTSPDKALDEEKRLIRRLRPRDNLIGQPDLEEAPF